MNPKRKQLGWAQETDVIPKLEGMEIEFDEKVTLFPVDLEEIRDVVPKRSSVAARNGRATH
ncbi:MAG TPA: hypothetical protein VFS77_02775 [Pyrinomonadaceae bacterium]|nr:hypothetical protein [Pyrinomonadaceae bacterium]HKU76261.1 hypothetical protein [Pyrinomonadaceae bacterium]